MLREAQKAARAASKFITRGSTLVVLEGAGHVCNPETPDAVSAAVSTFLERVLRG